MKIQLKAPTNKMIDEQEIGNFSEFPRVVKYGDDRVFFLSAVNGDTGIYRECFAITIEPKNTLELS